jgi:hypothetical protein
MAFDEHVATVAMFPTMVHPVRMPMRRSHPYARNPYVRVSIPAMITALVYVTFMRRSAAHFDNRARRCHLNDNLLAHCTHRQQAPGY